MVFDHGVRSPDYSGTLLNGAGLTAGGALTGSTAASFDGVNDVITAPGIAGLMGGPFAASAWVFADSSVVNEAYILGFNDANFFSGFNLTYFNGKIQFRITRLGVGQPVTVENTLPLNTWVHVTASYDGDSLDLFLNGAAAGSSPVSPGALIEPHFTSIFEIGGDAQPNGFGNPFSGSIDEVAVFTRALTAADAATLYTARHGIAGAHDLTLTVNGQIIAVSEADDGSYVWNVPANIATGPATVGIQSSAVTGTSQSFLLVNSGTNYYLNDAVFAPGDFTTAAGNDANTGKSPDSPMRNLAELLRLYDLDPGDIVHMDAGTYVFSDDVVIGAADSGVTIRGLSSAATIIDRNNRNPGTAAFRVNGASGVTLENLAVTGADTGIVVEASSGFTLRGADVYENASGGVSTDTLSSGTTVANSTFRGLSGDELRDQDRQVKLFGTGGTLTNNTAFRTGALVYSVSGVDNGDIGFEVDAFGAVSITGNTAYNINYAFSLTMNAGAVATVSGNTGRDSGNGFSIYSGAGIYNQFFNNTARDNALYGIIAGGWWELYGNSATENDVGYAMHSGISHSTVRVGVDDARGGNIAALNRTGIEARDAFVYRNTVYGNTGNGIEITGDPIISGNRVYSNGAFGIQHTGQILSTTVENNLVYDNGNGGIDYLPSGFLNQTRVVRNNTVFQDAGTGIRIGADGNGVIFTNNLVVINAGSGIVFDLAPHATFVADYNLVFSPTGAASFGMVNGTPHSTIAAWRTATGRDAHSLQANPFFTDMDGPDNILGYDAATLRHGGDDDLFSLRAGSPAIDAGESIDAQVYDLYGLLRRDDPGTVNTGGNAYLLSNPSSGSVFSSPLGGTALGLRGNNLVQQITLPFAFPFYGTNHTTLWVSDNGLLQFTTSLLANVGNNSTIALDDFPRIAVLWDDLTTSGTTADNVFRQDFADRMVLRWDATLPGTGNDVQFAVTLYANGSIRFDYGPGNTGLTPTTGISDGIQTGRGHLLLTDADGRATLTNWQSALLTWGPGMTDIGALEFGGSTLDTTPPVIMGSNPSAVAGSGVLLSSGSSIQLTFSEPLNPASAGSSAAYSLLSAGSDGIFGNQDDALVGLTPSYVPGTTSVTLNLTQPLAFGLYRLTAAGALVDLSGLALAGDGTTAGSDWVRTFSVGAGLAAAHLAYAGSVWDTGAANLAPAIAPDKTALLPGQTGSFANISSYSRGLNALVVDLANPLGALGAADFTFTAGNDALPGGWAAAPAPLSVTSLPGQGVDGTMRVVIRWADGAIVNEWLRVRINVTASTRLAAPVVFYFAHQHGDTGAADAVTTHSLVNSADTLAVQQNPRGANNPAAITDPRDFNRDRQVNALDFGIARDNAAGVTTALLLLSSPAAAPPLPDLGNGGGMDLEPVFFKVLAAPLKPGAGMEADFMKRPAKPAAGALLYSWSPQPFALKVRGVWLVPAPPDNLFP